MAMLWIKLFVEVSVLFPTYLVVTRLVIGNRFCVPSLSQIIKFTLTDLTTQSLYIYIDIIFTIN